jgi:tRNA threonylcarbamoyladenosine biosynthesis protein TsaB
MKLLAFDTSTDRLSIALTCEVEGQARLWQHNAEGGAKASTDLIPAIEALMAQAGLRFEDLDAIAFGQGPGSFTGLRTACAVAQGLGFAAKRPLLPVDTLLAVAEEARFLYAPEASTLRVQAMLDARMDEVYTVHCVWDRRQWTIAPDIQLRRPEQAVLPQEAALAGNVFEVYGERLPITPAQVRWPAWPTATAMLRLAPQLLAAGAAVDAAQALPRYIRDKVAQTTQEREAAKAQT